MSNTVLVDTSEGVATITLNRPEALNALSKELRHALYHAIRAAEAAKDVRAIIITGAGDRAFTAGVDLKELGQSTDEMRPDSSEENVIDPVREIERCRKPVIGAVNGVAVTGGFELALACDLLIASDNARFADTHVHVGILPGWGLSQRLSRVVGIGRAKELSFTGNFLSAERAYEWGLVNHVVPLEELMPLAQKLAGNMASVDGDFLRTYKKLINDGFAASFGESLEIEKRVSGLANQSVTPDEVEHRRAQIQDRGRQQ